MTVLEESENKTNTTAEKKWTWNEGARTARKNAYAPTRVHILELLGGNDTIKTTVTTVLRDMGDSVDPTYDSLNKTDRRLVIRKVLADLVRENSGTVTKEASPFRTGKRGNTETYSW